jgi:hypothetical protein
MSEFLSYEQLEEMMNQEEEREGYDPTKDANAAPPPPPAGKYVVKVEFQEQDPAKRWERKTSKKGATYLNTTVVCTIADNPANPPEVINRRFVVNNIMTLVNNQGGTEVTALIQALGAGPELVNGPRTSGHEARVLSDALTQDPLVGVEIDWEASYYNKEKEVDEYDRVRGMKNFPKNEDGTHYHFLPKGSYDGQARVYKRRWIALQDLTEGVTAGTPVYASQAKTAPKATPPVTNVPGDVKTPGKTPVAPAPAPRKAPGRR